MREIIVDQNDPANTSDGYHTFRELYAHRVALFILLMRLNPQNAWWSKLHHDGTMFEGGYIIAGLTTPFGQVTYHLQDKYIQYLENTDVPYLDLAPEWDGHTPNDVVDRLLKTVEAIPPYGEIGN